MRRTTIITCNVPVEITSFEDGTILLERWENNDFRYYFVCTGEKDSTFYLQENYPNGDIRDIATYTNLVDALQGIAWASHQDNF